MIFQINALLTAATDIVPLSYGDTTTLGLILDLDDDIQASVTRKATCFWELQQMFKHLKTKKKLRKSWRIGGSSWILHGFQIKICVPGLAALQSRAHSVVWNLSIPAPGIPELKKKQVHQPLGLPKNQETNDPYNDQ